MGQCYGPSMCPTLNPAGDIVLVNKFSSYSRSSFKTGDVVIATSPHNPCKTVCKRITAMEGDRILVMHNDGLSYQMVPPGHVWIEGDNKHQSYDSRAYGPIPVQLLQGKAVLRIWPMTQLGRI
eukprot:Phypoly_transcript_18917.p1 GENE.Phypoly_transcript_18917~~Phypoly_transcript_18917.p1  ORF type:complete len:123 (-),score=10.93 Phypoly_transcript_18917:153-521(-)